MDKIIMRHADGTTYLLSDRSRASAVTNAEQRMVLLGEDTVTITVETAGQLPLVIGDSAEIFGKTYTMNKLPQIRKTGERRLQYTITMEGPQYRLIDVQFILSTPGMSDSYTGDLAAHMTQLKDCLNRRYGTTAQPHPWAFSIAEGVGTEYKTFDFGGRNCLEALQQLCQEYGTEFEMTTASGVTTIAVGTAGQVITALGTFRYGKGGGLYELSRTNVDSSDIVTRLYVFGGTQNLPQGYPYKRLLISGATSRANSYVEDAQAIERYGIKENTINLDDIVPMLEEHNAITSLGTGAHAEQYFIVSDFPFDINGAMIPGTSPSVTMQTGSLAGYHFELVSYNHTTKTFRVKPYEDENRMQVPSPTSETFRFGVGDTFLIGDITMPVELVNAAKTKLAEQGQEELDKRKHPKVSYSLQLDSMRLARQMAQQAGTVEVFHPGDYIPVQDDQLAVDGNIRITAVTRDILHPYNYKLTLGDGSVQSTVLTRIISEMQKTDGIIRMNQLQDPTRRHNSWRTTQELLGMIFDTDGYFTDHIRPQSIETQMLEVGARSQQLMLSGVAIEPNRDGLASKIYLSAGSVTAYALEDAPRTWNLTAQTQADLNPAKAYYVYIKADTATGSTNASYLVTDAKYKAFDTDTDAAHYYFLLGTLSSPNTDAQGGTYRILSLTYGETTINGRWIRTGRIMDSTGGTFIDLDENKLRIGDSTHFIDFNNLAPEQLTLKRVKVLSDSGRMSDIGLFRGVYNAYETYYYGDEVSYTAGGETASYRCIAENGITGVVPTDATKWTCVAKGKEGAPGQAASGIQNISEVYGSSASETAEPAAWYDSVPTYSASKPYLWNALKITLSDSQQPPIYVDKECLGYGVSNVRERYARTINSTPPPHATLAQVESAPWSDVMTSVQTSWPFLWNLEILEYIDGRPKTWTDPACIAHYGQNGENGQGIRSMTEVYANSSSATQEPQDSEWQPTIPAHSASKPFLWNALKVTYTTNDVIYTDKECLGEGVKAVTEYYMLTGTSDQPATPSPSSMTGWSRNMASVTPQLPYLWNTELLEYYDSRQPSCTTPSLIAHYGKDGSAGRGVSNVVEQYSTGTRLQPQGTWLDYVIPQATTTTPYIWNREKIIYTTGDPTYTTAQLMGKDIETITEEYAVNSSGTEAPTTGWGTYESIRAQFTKGRYLWNRERITYSNGYAPTTTEPACIGYQGTDGTRGEDAPEIQPNLLADSLFEQGLATGISVGEGWWERNGSVCDGIDGHQAFTNDNVIGTSYINMLNQVLFHQNVTQKIEPGTWYTLSFWARGTGLTTYLYGSAGHQVIDTSQSIYADGSAETPAVDGTREWQLDTLNWTKHTYTFKTQGTVISDGVEKNVLFRLLVGQAAQVCMPKLERGTQATAFCVRQEDTVNDTTYTFRGEWTSTKTYVGTPKHRDIVRHNGVYYRIYRTAGEIGANKPPTNTDFWDTFDAQFESVATGLLFAEEAVIENAVVRKLRTSDGDGDDKKRVQITGNQFEAYDSAGNMKTKISGEDISSASNSTEHTVTGIRRYPSNSVDGTRWWEWEFEFDLASFNVTATNNVVTFPQLRNWMRISVANAWAELYMDVQLDGVSARQTAGGNDGTFTPYYEWTDDFTIAARSMSVGTHTLKLKIHIRATAPQGTTGSFAMDFYTDLKTAGTKIRVQYINEMVEVGANGYKAIFGDSDHQVIFVRDPQTDAITLQVRNGSSGIEFTGGNTYMWYGNTKYKLTRSNDGTVKLSNP